jgi:hypothetical protein
MILAIDLGQFNSPRGNGSSRGEIRRQANCDDSTRAADASLQIGAAERLLFAALID